MFFNLRPKVTMTNGNFLNTSFLYRHVYKNLFVFFVFLFNKYIELAVSYVFFMFLCDTLSREYWYMYLENVTGFKVNKILLRVELI